MTRASFSSQFKVASVHRYPKSIPPPILPTCNCPLIIPLHIMLKQYYYSHYCTSPIYLSVRVFDLFAVSAGTTHSRSLKENHIRSEQKNVFIITPFTFIFSAPVLHSRSIDIGSRLDSLVLVVAQFELGNDYRVVKQWHQHILMDRNQAGFNNPLS